MEQLPGSMANGGRVFRREDTVLRPVGPHAAAVDLLLEGLASRGFPAPVPAGCHDGMAAFGWIDGEVPVPPFPAWSLTEASLQSAGRLLADYHAAASGLPLPDGLAWSAELADPAGGTFICHNDVCPENMVFRDGRAFALLDFDFAAPGRPLWDLAQMARMWCPLLPPELVSETRRHLRPWERLRILTRAYGLDEADRPGFVEMILESWSVAEGFLRRRLDAGEPAFVQAWEPRGGVHTLDRIRAWYRAQQGTMLEALEEGPSGRSDPKPERLDV